MPEKFPTNKEEVYDESGRVKDPDVAQEMAEAEAPFHKKTLGVFSPSEKKLEEGEHRAEEALENILQENIDNEDADAAIAALIPEFQKIRDALWASNPGYAAIRQKNWDRIEKFIQDKERFRNRQNILGLLANEILLHEESEGKENERVN